MLDLFKQDPMKKLHKQYHDKLQQAIHAQRNGDIRSYATLSVEADSLLKSIQKIQDTKHKPLG